MRNTITRSFNKVSATVLVYVDGKISEKKVNIPYLYNNVDLAEKYIRKNVNLDGKLVTVTAVEKVSTLYGMDEADFIKLAKAVDNRSKETRGMISKTVIGYVGTLLYMDEKRSVKDISVLIPKGVKLDKVARESTPKGCVPITIENVKETETLFVMDEQTFIDNAREMSDHQHYIIK